MVLVRYAGSTFTHLQRHSEREETGNEPRRSTHGPGTAKSLSDTPRYLLGSKVPRLGGLPRGRLTLWTQPGSLSDALSPREGLDPSGLREYKGARAPAGRDDPRVKIVVFVLVSCRRMCWVFARGIRDMCIVIFLVVFRDFFSCCFWSWDGARWSIFAGRTPDGKSNPFLLGCAKIS